jgi:tripartite-type tricarboxylate transporter receptor subunit TctC
LSNAAIRRRQSRDAAIKPVAWVPADDFARFGSYPTAIGPRRLIGSCGFGLFQIWGGSTPALTDLLGGQVQVVFDATPSSLPHIRGGKLRPLAVTTATRLEILPDTPTVGHFVPGYEASTWLGFGAPKNTPAAVIDRLNKEINLAISDSAIKARLADLGGVGMPPSSPAEFGKLIADDTEKWAGVIRRANSRAAQTSRN